LEKRQKIRYWEEERDDLNEKLDDCQDKVFLPKADRESMTTDELILESKVNEVYHCTVPVKSLPV